MKRHSGKNPKIGAGRDKTPRAAKTSCTGPAFAQEAAEGKQGGM